MDRKPGAAYDVPHRGGADRPEGGRGMAKKGRGILLVYTDLADEAAVGLEMP